MAIWQRNDYAKQTTLALVKTAVDAVTTAVTALRGQLPTTLDNDGRLKVGLDEALTLPVESRSVEFEVTARSALGGITAYTEGGVDWTISRDPTTDDIVSVERA